MTNVNLDQIGAEAARLLKDAKRKTRPRSPRRTTYWLSATRK